MYGIVGADLDQLALLTPLTLKSIPKTEVNSRLIFYKSILLFFFPILNRLFKNTR